MGSIGSTHGEAKVSRPAPYRERREAIVTGISTRGESTRLPIATRGIVARARPG
jgi:hypothetical protein